VCCVPWVFEWGALHSWIFGLAENLRASPKEVLFEKKTLGDPAVECLRPRDLTFFERGEEEPRKNLATDSWSTGEFSERLLPINKNSHIFQTGK